MSFGKGGGGSAPDFSKDFTFRTPGFNLRSFQDQEKTFNTLTRLDTPIQQAFAERFPRILQDLDKLRGTIKPGFSEFRQAGLANIANTFGRARGNLRDSAARRRIAGSSFATAELSRLAAEEGQAGAGFEAQSFLAELQANAELLSSEQANILQGIGTELAELGLVTGVGVQLADLVSRQTQFAQEFAAKSAGGRGKLFGTLLGFAGSVLGGPIGGMAGSALGGLIGGGGGGGRKNPGRLGLPGSGGQGGGSFSLPIFG